MAATRSDCHMKLLRVLGLPVIGLIVGAEAARRIRRDLTGRMDSFNVTWQIAGAVLGFTAGAVIVAMRYFFPAKPSYEPGLIPGNLPVPAYPAHLCPYCRHNVAGLQNRLCPECGARFTDADARRTGRTSDQSQQ